MNKIIIGSKEQTKEIIMDDLGLENLTVNNLLEIHENEQKFSPEQIAYYIEYFQYFQENEKKVAVIYDADLLSEIQQNKLLKTIEGNSKEEFHYFQVSNTSKFISPLISRMSIVRLDSETDDFNLSKSEKDYFEVFEDSVKKFEELLFDNNMTQIIQWINNEFEINKVSKDIYLRILESYIFSKDKTLINIYLNYIQRMSYNVDYSLQLECLLIELNNKIIIKEDNGSYK